MSDAAWGIADISQKQAGFSQTEYHVTGELESVFRAIKLLFRDWHPMGYGTRVQSLEMQPNGHFMARITRANSCD